MEKPRLVVIFSLQTNRKNNKTKDSSVFDHCKVTNVRLFLNSQYYPYERLGLKFSENNIVLYEMFVKFRQSYYNCPVDPLLDLKEFKEKAPLFILD